MNNDDPVDILIVDDRPDKLLALEAILAPLKENIIKATSGGQALRLLLKHDFAVLLLDVQMPHIDGFETAELIRQNERTKHLPIIFVSAFEPTNERLKRVYSLGAVDYVPSPGAPEALLAKVAVFVELHRKNRTLAKLVHQMNEKTTQLNDFCYTIAHDLRAPLRAITGFAEVLREDKGNVLNDNGTDCLKRIVASSHRLDRLIQDLLGYTRLERVPINGQEVELGSVIDAALKHLEQQIKETGAEVFVRHPLPRVLSNKGALEHVFLNLISNALKFSRNGISPKVSIYGEDQPHGVRVWVEDNGIGIAPQYRDRIFGMFEKVNDGVKYPGTGAGLAIVAKAIERLGGSKGVESDPNVGSRFWIELPKLAQPTSA